MSPPPAAEAVVEAYSAVIDTALVKARTVIVSSGYPRLTTTEATSTIDAVNAGLVSLCDEKNVAFINNTPSFTLSDGSVNDGISRMGYISRQPPSVILSDGSVSDGYLQRDGVHLTQLPSTE